MLSAVFNSFFYPLSLSLSLGRFQEEIVCGQGTINKWVFFNGLINHYARDGM